MSLKGGKKNYKYNEPDDDSWIHTFADCATLLLCFFVILLSISEPKADKFEAITEAMSSGFVTDMIELPFKALYDDFQVIIEAYAVELDVAAEYTDKGLRIDIGAGALFAPGSATIATSAMPMLRDMVVSIKEMDMENYRVVVEGHTDDNPVTLGGFASNWELSAMRAAGVARILADEGIDKERMQVSAFSDVQPKVNNRDVQGLPISENQAQNRRIVIHVMRGE